MRCINLIPLLLLLLLLPPAAAAFRQLFSAVASPVPTRLLINKGKQPWLCPVEPDASVQELEETATDEYIDDTIQHCVGMTGGHIIPRYRPEGRWLWRRWRGTILQHGFKMTALNMGVSLLLVFALRYWTGATWKLGQAPDPDHHPVIARLVVFDKLWHQLLTLSTFILTFFVSQAYSLWKDVYNCCRVVQGRMNDIWLLLATHAIRDTSTGQYTAEARSLLDDASQYLTAFHCLLWSASSRRFRVLLTNRGLERMVAAGILTGRQKETLQQLDSNLLPVDQRHNACLEWTLIRCQRARQEGILTGGTGLEQVLLDRVCALRGSYASLDDLLDGRMPLVRSSTKPLSLCDVISPHFTHSFSCRTCLQRHMHILCK
jgi:hypothetical protein